MESLVSEKVHFQSALGSTDVASATLTSWVGVKGALKLRCLIRVESAAADVSVTLRQAQDASGTGAKDLLRCLPLVYKVDGQPSVLVEEADPAVASYTVADLNGAAGYIAIEVEGSNLDEGFTHFAVSVDGGASRLAVATFEADTEFKPAFEQDL